MKSNAKILTKIALLALFLYITPFFHGFEKSFTKVSGVLEHLVYKQKVLSQSISLKNKMNVLSYNSNLTLPKEDITVETTHENPVIIPSTENQKKTDTDSTKNSIPKKDDAKSNNQANTNPKDNGKAEKNSTGKKIYIYNTHQSEAYAGGETVMDAAAILAKKLEEKGFKVVLETNNFGKYLAQHGLDYNKSYVASYNYLNDALVNYGGFDLCLDLHRDSIPRSVSYIKKNGKTYAKGMMVVGGLGKNAKSATALSTTLTDIINAKMNGMMRSVMVRESYFNQEVHKNILLMELGGDVNTFDEIKNSLDVIADGIYDMLEKE